MMHGTITHRFCIQNNVDLARAATLLNIYSFLLAGGTIVQFINFVGGAITFCNVSVTQKFGLCTQTLPPSSPFFGEVAGDETTLAVAAREQTGLYFLGHLSSLVSFTPPYISEPHHLKLYY